MSRLHLQQLDLDWMIPGKSYVAISVAVGISHQPHKVTKRILTEFKENSALCRLLGDLDIAYDVMPCRVDSFSGGASFSIEAEEKYQGTVEEIPETLEHDQYDSPKVTTGHSAVAVGCNAGAINNDVGVDKSTLQIKIEGNPFSETLDMRQEKEPEYDLKEVGHGPTNPEELTWENPTGHRRRTIGDPKFNPRKLTERENSLNDSLFKKLIADID